MAKPKQTKTLLYKWHISENEAETLDRVATEHGLDRPNLLRMLVSQERRRLFGTVDKPNAKGGSEASFRT